MTLRKKMISIVSLTIVGLLVALYALSQFVVLGGFVQQEQQDARQDAERIKSALDDSLATLAGTTRDWSVWDDTYTFIQDSNSTYFKANLANASPLDANRLNIMLFVSASGQIIHTDAYDYTQKKPIPFPESLKKLLVPHSPLLRDTASSRKEGLISLPEGPMLVASEPILHSDASGPVMGTLIFGRYLDTAEISRLSKSTLLSLKAYQINDPKMPADFRAALASLSKKSPISLNALNSQTMEAYILLDDLFGNSALELEASLPRGVYAQGQATVLYFLVGLVVTGLIFGLMTLLLLERSVISRLARLSTNVGTVGRSGDLSARVSVQGNDELTRLGHDINGMLSALDSSTQERREGEERYRTVVEQASDSIYIFDPATGRFLQTNAAFLKLVGYALEEILQLTIYDVLADEHQEDDQLAEFALEKNQEVSGDRFFRHKNGLIIQTEVNVNMVSLEGREVFCVVARDVTERKRAEKEAAHRKSEQRFSALVQNTADLISILEADGTVRYQSPSAKQLLGYNAEDIIGSSGFAFLHDDDVITAQQLLAESLKKPGVNVVSELRVQHKDGSWLYLETIANNLLNDPNINGILLSSRDITERKRLTDQLEHQAFHDSLTGLPNRALFQDRLKHALARAGTDKGSAPSVAVLFLDLDGFKVINDSLGHKIGDMLLTVVAERLGECVRANDTVARLGRDEFTVILEDIAGEGDAVEAAERIAERMRPPFYIEGQEIFVSSSIGISLGASKDDRVTDFLRNADIAMYEAKGKGRGNYRLYEPEMNSRICQRLEMENDLRRALEREEFRVYYQPIVHLGTGKIVEVEALVRWQHPTIGLVPPLDFIPLAEETGLILPIGQWVMEEACKKVKTWHAQCLTDPPLILSVNLSGKQFCQQNLIEQIMCTLQETGLDPHFLELEITESVALDDVDATITMLQELKALGIQVAIDDFGIGYSALSYLKRFPADTLKLDKTFINGLGRDQEDTAIVQAVIEVAKALNLKVTAEGIETAEHLERLRGLDCDQGQGYYFSKPISAEAITALLASRLHWNKVEPGKVQKAKSETKPLERVGLSARLCTLPTQ